MTSARPPCPKCGGPAKLYPQEFDAAKWPFTVVPVFVKMAGGPTRADAFWVCTSCGHNFEAS